MITVNLIFSYLISVAGFLYLCYRIDIISKTFFKIWFSVASIFYIYTSIINIDDLPRLPEPFGQLSALISLLSIDGVARFLIELAEFVILLFILPGVCFIPSFFLMCLYKIFRHFYPIKN